MEEKRMKLDLKQFENVNYFNGIDRENLVIQGDMDIYVPHVIRQLWFRRRYSISRHDWCVGYGG